jgi:hypothetical protein
VHFGLSGTINSSVSSQGITVMAPSTKKPADITTDTAWEDIFESLTIETEPPAQYIRHVIINTKDGHLIKVSGKHWAEIVEQEKYLSPEQSEIHSCRLNINFTKVRNDVENYTSDLLRKLDGLPPEEKKTSKRRKSTN